MDIADSRQFRVDIEIRLFEVVLERSLTELVDGDRGGPRAEKPKRQSGYSPEHGSHYEQSVNPGTARCQGLAVDQRSPKWS
jgi:hypothetical protein